MATLDSLTDSVQCVLQDDSYTDLTHRINQAVLVIAGGTRLPDGRTSPSLPQLYEFTTLQTTALAYVDMPETYQRDCFYIVDTSGDRIQTVRGGDYYAFTLFMNHSRKKDFTEQGSIYHVCIRGRRLFYQGIPTAPTNVTVHYYRKPVDMVLGADSVDGLPEFLQERLIKHYVLKEIYGAGIEDGAEARGTGTSYHTGQFYEALTDLADYIGLDAEPEHYSTSSGLDDLWLTD